ncbi:hypothetical protein CFK37_07910 [Virgibacillus phasianinus]|uniref:DUF1146 domain-containing protein n=1 Tax=Virgibacillus phasianinus TaxID=2017483 RepID=A0A220U281_9BACI|nr:DUF1146 family protein [Virgibacillus phasianinus]ASK62092.1 hypothetical protein CFK37_07910 [Virgibacillus phasianinus]
MFSIEHIGQLAIVSMLSHLIFIAITWRVMQSINFDPILRKGRIVESRIFLLFVAIVIGSGVSQFFLDFLKWSQNLKYLF